MEVDEGEEHQYDGKGGRIGAAKSLARKGQADMIPGFWILILRFLVYFCGVVTREKISNKFDWCGLTNGWFPSSRIY